MPLNLLDHLANLIFISAYWVKDILLLRLLCILGSLTIIPYYLLQTEPLWAPTMWSIVFISIHATRAWGILKSRRPVHFSVEEQFLYEKAFGALSPNQFKRLLAIGEWLDVEPGRRLHSTGLPSSSLEVVVHGELETRRNGQVFDHARAGDLIGLASVLGGSPELFDTIVTQPTRILRWRLKDLHELANVDENLTSALRKTAGAALAEKLIRFIHAKS